MNRLPFPNRNSDSGVLYIDFKRFHLIFAVEHLDSQVESRFMLFLSYLAYASHTASRKSYHAYVVVVYYVVCFFLVLLLRVGSDNVAFVRTCSTTSVCLLLGLVSSSLRDFRQDDHTLEITTIFAMLHCSLFCYANATMPTTCFQASQIAMSNL